MIEVVAALIESNGKILVCQRREGGSFGLMWEFPGGKVEAGERPEQALTRELREELGIEAQIGEEVYRTVHRYSEMRDSVELTFFRTTVNSGRMENRVFEQIQWRTPQSLSDLEFLPADVELIARLAVGTLKLRSFET